MPRADTDVAGTLEVVRPIVDAVRHRGARGGPGVLGQVRRRASRTTSPCRAEAIAEALARAGPGDPGRAWRSRSPGCGRTCEAELEDDVVTDVVPGGRVTQRMVPIERVGLYVPGGLAPLVSSVVMNVVPAQVAGVALDRAHLLAAGRASAGCRTRRSWPRARCSASTRCTPSAAPRRSRCSRTAPAAAARSTWSPGPGNIYTVSAKRLVKGVVGIDSEAGPTEIAVLADDTADPAHVAADLISQAEHDPLAASVLVTPSEALADDVDRRARQAGVADQARRADPHRAHRAAVRPSCSSTTSSRGSTWSTPTPPSTWRSRPATPPPWAARVRNAGAVFVGPFAPVSLGDYAAGSNHVLPTAGCACHSSGLSVRSFRKAMHVVEYTEEALREVASPRGHARRGGGPARPRRRRTGARAADPADTGDTGDTAE